MPNEPKLVASSQGKAYSVLGDRYIFKVTGEETGGAYALFDFLILPGNGTPPHVHHREEEGFWILSGELTFYLGIDSDRVVARAGDYIHAPRDIPHFFMNEGKEPVKALCLVTPAGLEKFFELVGTPLPGPDSQPLPLNHAVDLPKVMANASKFGLEIFG